MLLLPFMTGSVPTGQKVMATTDLTLISRDVPIPERTDRLTISCKAATTTSTKTITVTAESFKSISSMPSVSLLA